MKILLAGCGDIGQRLGEILALQHECFGLRRDIKKISGPITPLQANLTDRPQILSILNQEFDVMCNAIDPSSANKRKEQRAELLTDMKMKDV